MMYRFPAAAAAAAFALLPLAVAAQDAQPSSAAQQPPVVDVPAPPAPPAPRAAPQRAPAAEAPADAGGDSPPPPPRVRTVRTVPARTLIVPAPASVAAPATTTTTTTTAAPPVIATVPTVPPATVPATAPPDTLNAAPPAGVDTVTPPPRAQQPQLDQHTAVWPWFALGAVLLAAAALLLANRRRRNVVAYDRVETAYEAPPPRVAEVAVAPAVVPVAAPDPVGVPAIALAMRPLRAGIDEDAAKVAFELTVDNRGTAEARDVRVATWMLAAGASEAERALIEPSAPPADTPPLDIPAGQSRMVEGQVALPRADIRGASVLPVVVANASYRLPDGSEARISARFAVGVPDGEELAHFNAEHPSGLHEGVIAHVLGEAVPG